MKIAVIGAGLSGLAAATRLQAAGHEVVVIEAGDVPGGRCKTMRRDGFIIDTCTEIAATSYTRWLEMIRSVGMGADIYEPRMIVGMLKDGHQIDIDVENLLALPFTPVMPWSAKFRVALGMLKLLPEIRSLPNNLMEATHFDDPAINTGELALKLFGPEAVKYFIDPFIRLAAGTRLDLISPLLLRSGLADFSRLITLRGGLDRVPKAVAAKLNVRYQTRVDQVHSNPDCVAIACIDSKGAKETICADKCLITAQFDDAERMYPRFAEIGKGYTEQLQYMRMVDIKLAYSAATRSKAWGVLIPFCEDLDINFLTLTHNKSPDRAPAGHSLIGFFTEHLEYDRMAAKSDEALVEWARSRAEALHPELKGNFMFSYVARQPRTCHLPVPGHFRITRQLWEDIGKEPRVHLGGDMFIYGSLESAVAMGERAADRLVATA